MTDSSAIRFSSLGLVVDAGMGGGKDFGKGAEVELADEGKGDGALVVFGPTFQPANK